jgi:hypothetical protein
VRDSGERDAHVHVEVLVEHVVVRHPDMVHDALQLVVEPIRLVIVRRMVRRQTEVPSRSAMATATRRTAS